MVEDGVLEPQITSARWIADVEKSLRGNLFVGSNLRSIWIGRMRGSVDAGPRNRYQGRRSIIGWPWLRWQLAPVRIEID